MWRRWGDWLYALTVLVVFGVEALALLALSLAFTARMLDLLPYARLISMMTGVVVLTSLSLALVMQHVLVYYAASGWHDRRRREASAEWTDLLVRWLFDRNTPLPRKLPREGVDALLDLRETLRGEDGLALGLLLSDFGVEAKLLRGARARAFGARLLALEGLAKARLPNALPTAFELLSDPSPVVRSMATRVLARTLAAMPEGREAEAGMKQLVHALRTTDLPAGVVEEALLLLDDAAASVVRALLAGAQTRPKVAKAALEAAGRLGLGELEDEITRYVEHPNPELRAAALGCVPKLHASSPALSEAIVRASAGPIEFVRVQATHALANVAPERALPTLWDRLEDASWWVRRAAAESLRAQGKVGLAELRRVVDKHPDRYAREIAQHVLREVA